MKQKELKYYKTHVNINMLFKKLNKWNLLQGKITLT